MSKRNAIEALQQQISKIEILKTKRRFSPEFNGWKNKTCMIIEGLYGKESTQYKSFDDVSYSFGFASSLMHDHEFEERFKKGLDTAKEIINSIIENFELFENFNEDIADPHKRALDILENIFNKFSVLVQIHQKRHGNRKHIEFEDEYDVQDFLHIFLAEHFDDVRDEETMPSYAGSSARADFFLKKEKIVIELKMTRKSLTRKDVRDELIIDKTLYKAHPDFEHIVCFIYDPIRVISNKNGFIEDLEQDSQNFRVFVTQ